MTARERRNRELARRRDAGDPGAVAILVAENLGLAGWAVKRYSFETRTGDYGDLFQSAALGLWRAAEKWDPDTAVLSTYATAWMYQAITRFVGDNSFDLSVPTTLGLQARSVAMGGHPANLTDNAEQLIRERLLVDNVSLDALIEEGTSLHHIVSAPLDDVDDRIDQEHTVTRVRAMIDALPERERDVVRMRMDGLTLQDVGERLGRTRERARQIETRAHERLRVMLAGNGTGVPACGTVRVSHNELEGTMRAFDREIDRHFAPQGWVRVPAQGHGHPKLRHNATGVEITIENSPNDPGEALKSAKRNAADAMRQHQERIAQRRADRNGGPDARAMSFPDWVIARWPASGNAYIVVQQEARRYLAARGEPTDNRNTMRVAWHFRKDQRIVPTGERPPGKPGRLYRLVAQDAPVVADPTPAVPDPTPVVPDPAPTVPEPAPVEAPAEPIDVPVIDRRTGEAVPMPVEEHGATGAAIVAEVRDAQQRRMGDAAATVDVYDPTSVPWGTLLSALEQRLVTATGVVQEVDRLKADNARLRSALATMVASADLVCEAVTEARAALGDA